MDKVKKKLKELWNKGYAQQADKPQVNEVMEWDINDCKAALCKVVLEEVDALIKTRYLTNKDIVRQLGWVDGHKKAIEEAKATIKKLFGEEL